MNLASGFHLIISGYLTLILHVSIAESYRVFQNESESTTFCLYKQHFIINPNLTCCNNTVVKPGINLFDHYDDCTSESQTASTAFQAAWNVYSCIIQSSNEGESRIDLSQFANLMTNQYPKEIQSQILKEVASVGTLSTDVSEMSKLDKIRRTYFDIEKQVCSETTTAEMDYGKDYDCKEWDEDLHRGGRCCGKNNLPFEIGINSFLDVDMFTLLKTEQCLQQLQNTVFPKPHKFSWAMENSIAEICDLSCELMERNVLQPDELQVKDDDEALFAIDFQPIALALIPTWLPSTAQEDAFVFVMENFVLNNTIERMTTFEITDVNDAGVLRHVPTQRFPTTGVHIPIICSAHREILAFIEHFLYTKSCDDDAGEMDSE